MAFFGASDLPAMLADFGVPIVWGAVTGLGIVDVVDRELFADTSVQFTGKEVQLTAETSKFGGLRERNTLTIDGVSHMVLQTRQTGDGALTEVLCVPTA